MLALCDILIRIGVPVQREMEGGRFPLVSIRPAGGNFQGMRVYRSDAIGVRAIRYDGEEELNRPISALAWSGLAAGMSMGFSLVAEALFRTYLPDQPWRPLITSLGYPLGFLIVIIGRQQLFTENTLTAIIPLLARRNTATLLRVARLWTVVLVANPCGRSSLCMGGW
jgi:formate/nitrite transporter FocA (FNT family)